MIWLLCFLASFGLIFYTLFGYPILVWALSKWRAHPIHKQSLVKPVTIILAVHNGARFLRAKLESLIALDYPRDQMQILVVSDGSTDATDAIAAEFASQGIELLRIQKSGKPSALNAGMARARGEILVFTDVRQTLHPQGLRYLMECLADPKVGCVSGRLLIRPSDHIGEHNVGLYWRYEIWLRNRLSQIDSIFGATGALYALRRELAVPLPSDTLLDDMHLPLAGFFRGYRLVVEERAIVYDFPSSLDAEFQRKVRTLAGNYQILAAYPQLLGPRNRMWMHFVSYKFARLLLPFALIALAISSFGLPSPWRQLAVVSQAVFYGLAVVDPWMPAALRRLTSPVRTFCVLMLATLCAVSILFIPARAFWKETRIAAH